MGKLHGGYREVTGRLLRGHGKAIDLDRVELLRTFLDKLTASVSDPLVEWTHLNALEEDKADAIAEPSKASNGIIEDVITKSVLANNGFTEGKLVCLQTDGSARPDSVYRITKITDFEVQMEGEYSCEGNGATLTPAVLFDSYKVTAELAIEVRFHYCVFKVEV